MEHIPALIAFGAGLLSFLSPCVLPLVPVYLASLCGPEIFEGKAAELRLPMFLHSLSFVIGFSFVFVTLGAVAGLVGFIISPSSVVVRIIVGSLLISLGIFMLLSLKVPWLNYERRLTPSLGTTTDYLRAFLTGGVFCLAWTPCVSPILGGILSLALDAGTVWHGAYLLAIYSLGLGLPFLVLGIAFDTVSPFLKRIRHYSSTIYIFSGILLIAVGLLTLLDKLIWFSI